MTPTLSQRLVAELLGTAFLLAAVVGSGIMAAKLAGGNPALALLGNTLPTGAILVVLIMALGPVSGAHFNPAVTLAFLWRGEISRRDAALYVAAQIVGGIAGVAVAHAMFDLPLWEVSQTVRAGPGQWLAEGVATFGLVLTDLLLSGCGARSDPPCRRALHHFGLLVHGLHVVRQSRGDGRAFSQRYIRRHRAIRGRRLYRRADRWRVRGAVRCRRALSHQSAPAGLMFAKFG